VIHVRPMCLLLALSSAAHGSQPVSAHALFHDIQARGAKTVVSELVNQGKWDRVSDEIASGRRDWIEIVPALAAGTDAGSSEDLGIDLAFALVKNPASVLRVVDEKPWSHGGIIGIERVCGAPFIEDTEPKNYFSQAIQAVQRISDPALTLKKQACLTNLAHAHAGHAP
jgi:hypothetical protein